MSLLSDDNKSANILPVKSQNGSSYYSDEKSIIVSQPDVYGDIKTVERQVIQKNTSRGTTKPMILTGASAISAAALITTIVTLHDKLLHGNGVIAGVVLLAIAAALIVTAGANLYKFYKTHKDMAATADKMLDKEIIHNKNLHTANTREATRAKTMMATAEANAAIRKKLLGEGIEILNARKQHNTAFIGNVDLEKLTLSERVALMGQMQKAGIKDPEILNLTSLGGTSKVMN